MRRFSGITLALLVSANALALDVPITARKLIVVDRLATVVVVDADMMIYATEAPPSIRARFDEIAFF